LRKRGSACWWGEVEEGEREKEDRERNYNHNLKLKGINHKP
jgi:hypothetical protein